MEAGSARAYLEGVDFLSVERACQRGRPVWGDTELSPATIRELGEVLQADDGLHLTIANSNSPNSRFRATGCYIGIFSIRRIDPIHDAADKEVGPFFAVKIESKKFALGCVASQQGLLAQPEPPPLPSD